MRNHEKMAIKHKFTFPTK